MSDLFMGATILQSINSLFQWIMLFIDSVIYWFASQCYQLFIKLSMTQIFSENFFQNFANRIYAVLGVFMLFYLAYALLNALVDPDKLAKGDKSVSKLASNLVISLVILGLLPSIFQYAYRLQNYVLSSNIIGSLIFGTGTIDPNSDTDESMIRFGDSMSFLVLNTFLNPDNYNVRIDDNKTWFDVKYEILHDSDYGSITGLADAIAYGNAPVVTESGDGEPKQVEYKVVLSSLAGIYLCYIMLSFTLDLGVRIVKLAFCQLIAPIPIILRATPGKKGTFDKWLKLTLSVYFEVFVRVAIMYISIYFINEIADSAIFEQFFSGGIQGMLAMVIVILGVLTFAKQAPKMISDVLGIETGNLKFGIKDKLKAGGALTGAAMIGAGATGLTRNLIAGGMNVFGKGRSAFNDFKGGNIKSGLKNLGGAVTGIGTGALSTIAGGTSGMFNAFKAGKDAKGYGDVVKAAGTGARKSTENREARLNYKSSHGNTIRGAVIGHTQDAWHTVEEWSGYSKGLNELKNSQNLLKSVSDSRKSVVDQLKFIRDTIEEGKRHVSFTYDDINGNSHNVNNAELGYLRQHYEHLKISGASAEDLRNMELLVKAAEKQANKDIANGIKKDGVTRITNISDYNAELKARINKLMTDINAANQALSKNVENNVNDLESAKEFTLNHKQDDVAELAISGTKVFEELVDKINKPAIEANGKINQEINKYIEKKENKK